MSGYFFFWKHRFGQWTLRDIVIDGITYNCCEQWMMAEKARLFGDATALEKIILEKSPKKQQAFGQLVTPFDEDKWSTVARDVVFKGNLAKFTQHQDLKLELLQTGDMILAEASPSDLRWGIGLSASNPKAKNRSLWRGSNWLGEILMRVRQKIRQETSVDKTF